jgi:DNA-binding NarL/FixJ family response regulator
MRRLSERDASAALALVSELKELDEPLPFPPRLLAEMGKLIASDTVAYNELDPVTRSSIVLVTWRNGGGADEIVWGKSATPDLSDLWWRLRPTHPVCGYRTTSGDWTKALKVSDFVTLREFRRTPIYDAFYRGVLDHWLDVGLAPAPTRTRVFLFQRKRPDFDERDRLVLDLLQPHLAARAEAAETARRGAAALAALEEGSSDDAARVVLCGRKGVIEFASPSSRAVLERYLEIENGRVPLAVLGCRKLRLAHADRRLHVRIAQTGGLHVLMLDERDTRIEKLTTRERQILEHVALGRENDEIALELGLASATVAKHLEHVYRKLGVPNRTAAAAHLDRS